MPDISVITSLLSSIKSTHEIVKAGMDLRDAMKVDVELSKIMRQVRETEAAALAVQKDYAAALNRIESLEQDLVRLRYQQQDKDRYALQRVYPGAFAYVLKSESACGESVHWACQSCFDNGKKSVLKVKRRERRMQVWHCDLCKMEFETNPAVDPDNPFTPRT